MGVEYYLGGQKPDRSDCVTAANGSTYRKDIDGVVPNIIIDYYNERVTVKNMMLAAQKEYQKIKRLN